MNGIAVIGTSMMDLVVLCRQAMEMERCNKAQIVRSFGGSMHNVAYNCGCLGLETHFISKFGRDDTGLAIINELQKKTCFVYGPVVNQNTPVFISASDSEKGLYFSSIQPEFLFQGALLRHQRMCLGNYRSNRSGFFENTFVQNFADTVDFQRSDSAGSYA